MDHTRICFSNLTVYPLPAPPIAPHRAGASTLSRPHIPRSASPPAAMPSGNVRCPEAARYAVCGPVYVSAYVSVHIIHPYLRSYCNPPALLLQSYFGSAVFAFAVFAPQLLFCPAGKTCGQKGNVVKSRWPSGQSREV